MQLISSAGDGVERRDTVEVRREVAVNSSSRVKGQTAHDVDVALLRDRISRRAYIHGYNRKWNLLIEGVRSAGFQRQHERERQTRNECDQQPISDSKHKLVLL